MSFKLGIKLNRLIERGYCAWSGSGLAWGLHSVSRRISKGVTKLDRTVGLGSPTRREIDLQLQDRGVSLTFDRDLTPPYIRQVIRQTRKDLKEVTGNFPEGQVVMLFRAGDSFVQVLCFENTLPSKKEIVEAALSEPDFWQADIEQIAAFFFEVYYCKDIFCPRKGKDYLSKLLWQEMGGAFLESLGVVVFTQEQLVEILLTLPKKHIVDFPGYDKVIPGEEAHTDQFGDEFPGTPDRIENVFEVSHQEFDSFSLAFLPEATVIFGGTFPKIENDFKTIYLKTIRDSLSGRLNHKDFDERKLEGILKNVEAKLQQALIISAQSGPFR